MSEGIAYCHEGGEIDDNRTTVVLANNTAKTEYVVVPANERWKLFGGVMHNGDDVTRNCTVTVTDSSNNIIFYLLNTTAIAAGVHQSYPKAAGMPVFPVPLKGGWKLRFRWETGGASTGGNAYPTAIATKVRK